MPLDVAGAAAGVGAVALPLDLAAVGLGSSRTGAGDSLAPVLIKR